MTNEAKPPKRFVRVTRTPQKIGVCLSTIDDWCNPKSKRFDPSFPRKVKFGPRATGFSESELDAWMDSKSSSAEMGLRRRVSGPVVRDEASTSLIAAKAPKRVAQAS